MMETTRAAVGYLNRTGYVRPESAMYAFLDIFHPEIPEAERKKMAHESQS